MLLQLRSEKYDITNVVVVVVVFVLTYLVLVRCRTLDQSASAKSQRDN